MKTHVKGIIVNNRSVPYEQVIATPALIITYATTSEVKEHAETRRKTMCAWTMEVLRELEIENWAGIFRFTSLDYTRLYEQGRELFTSPVWYRHDAPSTPVPLLGS